MASEVDSELTSALTDPSSGSLLGDKTTGEGAVACSLHLGSIHDTGSSGHPHESQPQISVSENEKKTTPIPSCPQSGNDPQSESVIKEDNVDEPEKTGGDVGSSGDSAHKEEDESPVKIQKLEETGKTRDINERGDGFKHTDEADEEMGEDEHQDQDMISDEKAEPEPEPSLKEKTTPIPSSPQSGNDPQSESVIKEDNVDEPEKTGGESPVNIQRPNEAEKAGDINERGEHTDEEMGEIEDQDQDTEGKRELEPTLKESLQQNAFSGLPQDQPQISMGWNDKLFFAVCVLLVSCCVGLYFSDSTPPVPKEFNVVDVFNQEMEKLKTNFPNQRPELWRRSLIHIRRHLKTEQPTEPVSLILTSGHGAERTLDCLARCLAQAFSIARNSSFLNIDGKSKASQDSDQVKLDIDSELRNAFEGKKFAAVIHRFEELPPGSTLIFYRYCDHENAAYKNVFLAFTVMLDGEVEVPSNVNLGRVEEMVQEHVKQKFVSSNKLATFNQMDVDKLSGLWSRISHLILPVAAEKKIEQQGCGDCDK